MAFQDANQSIEGDTEGSAEAYYRYCEFQLIDARVIGRVRVFCNGKYTILSTKKKILLEIMWKYDNEKP